MQISALQSLDPNGVLLSEEREKELTSICYDSRQVIDGCAFFCFPGTRTNGEMFITEAISKGVALIVTENVQIERVKGVSYFFSTLPIRTLYAKASCSFFDHPSERLKLIGITGTDGKTSTTYFTYQLLKMFGKRVGLLNTVYCSDGLTLTRNDTHMSTPESFFVNKLIKEAVDNSSEYFVLEATSHSLSPEYDRLRDITFTLSAFTNISSEHLEFHKTYERYIDAKCELARRTKKELFIFDDNKEVKRVLGETNVPPVVLHTPKIIDSSLDKLTFEHEHKIYTLPFGQTYNLENAFEAANIVSHALTIDLSAVLEKLCYLKPVKGRFQKIDNDIRRNIIIDFAHTPKAYQAIMENTLPYKGEHSFIAVFGSSGKRDSSKRPEMGAQIAKYCDKLIITEDDNRGEDLSTIFKELTEKIEDKEKLIRIDDREDAIEFALTHSKEGDFIFLLGIGPQTGIDKGTYTKAWDEEERVLSIISRLKEG